TVGENHSLPSERFNCAKTSYDPPEVSPEIVPLQVLVPLSIIHCFVAHLPPPAGLTTNVIRVTVAVASPRLKHAYRTVYARCDSQKGGVETAAAAQTVVCGAAGQSPAMTYSRARSTTIGPGRLTAVFGMGTGVAARVCSPGKPSVYTPGAAEVDKSSA